MYGVIEYNEEGMPKCEVCGKFFHRVLSHVRQKHQMNEKEYKANFGFDLHKGICSQESAARTREKTLENYDLCIAKNLIANGKKSRFSKGSAGRTRDKVSHQTRLKLKENSSRLHKHKTLLEIINTDGEPNIINDLIL